MEKPTDAYKETHNLILAPKDTYTGGQVSSLQVSSSAPFTFSLITFCSGQLYIYARQMQSLLPTDTLRE